jgi:hypothetical protein
MAIPDHATWQKTRVTIVAVDPSQRKIQATFQDGGATTLALFEVPAAFRWPQVGEVWTAYRHNIKWMLGERLNIDSQETFPITTISGGQLRLDSNQIFTASGLQLIPIAGHGSAILTSGSAVVQAPYITNQNLIWVGAQDNLTVGALRVSSRIPQTSFDITSSNGADHGKVGYIVYG